MPDGSSLRIMVVEDQAAMRQLICSSLRQIGCHSVVECGDGQAALKEFSERPVQLILSDLNMPNLDGLGLLRAIRGKPGFEKTPFILLTSRAEVSIVTQAKELKVNNYIVKPFNLVVLKNKIQAVVGTLT